MSKKPFKMFVAQIKFSHRNSFPNNPKLEKVSSATLRGKPGEIVVIVIVIIIVVAMAQTVCLSQGQRAPR